MHIAVLGAGGIGCWLAARLALAGQRASLLARGSSLAAIRRDGLRATSVDGSAIGVCAPPLLRVYGPDEEPPASVDVVFIAVKTHQLEACLPQLAALLRASPGALVVPLLNGVNAHDVLADGLRALGLGEAAAASVMGGLAKSIVYLSEPGVVVLERELSIAVGPVRASQEGATPQLRALLEASRVITAAGLRCDLVESAAEMHAALWSKFLVTGCLGPFSAAARAPVDVLMRTEESALVVRQLMTEMAAVGRAGGVPVPENAVDEAMAICGRSPPGATYSTTRDVLGGRPSELLEFCGVVAALGRERRVPTPAHAQLLATLLPQERLARGELAYELRGV